MEVGRAECAESFNAAPSSRKGGPRNISPINPHRAGKVEAAPSEAAEYEQRSFPIDLDQRFFRNARQPSFVFCDLSAEGDACLDV